MVKNKTRQKPVNAWVSLCLVTKRLANWGELLSNRPLVRLQSGTYKRHESKDLWRFFFQKFMSEYKMHKYKFLLIGLELLYHLLLIKSMCLLIRKLANSVLISY